MLPAVWKLHIKLPMCLPLKHMVLKIRQSVRKLGAKYPTTLYLYQRKEEQEMKKISLIITFLLSAVLLSSVCFSLTAAQDGQDILQSRDPPDQLEPDSSDNSDGTLTQDGNEILYAIEDNRTEPQKDPAPEVPGAEDANLIATNTNSEENLPIVVAAIVLAIVVSVLAVIVCYTKFVKKKD